MNAPDFIWLYEREAAQLSTDLGPSKSVDLLQYVRRDPAVLAALPEMQAMLAAKDAELARLRDAINTWSDTTFCGCDGPSCFNCSTRDEALYAALTQKEPKP